MTFPRQSFLVGLFVAVIGVDRVGIGDLQVGLFRTRDYHLSHRVRYGNYSLGAGGTMAR